MELTPTTPSGYYTQSGFNFKGVIVLNSLLMATFRFTGQALARVQSESKFTRVEHSLSR